MNHHKKKPDQSNHNLLVKTPSPGSFLVVDDDEGVRKLLVRMLSLTSGWLVESYEDVKSALQQIKDSPGRYDVVFTDLVMPEHDGFYLLNELDRIDSSIVRVVITGNATADNIIASIKIRVFDVIKKPIELDELRLVASKALALRHASRREIKYKDKLEFTCAETTFQLRKTVDALLATQRLLIEKFAAMVDMRENQTGAHSKRVSRMFEVVARKAGLPHRDVERLSCGALLHDIGKVAVPDAILLKEEPLTDAERATINSHVEQAASLLKDIPFISDAADVVLYHHERYDGLGYPEGLSGCAIPLSARIFAVIDSYDAMRSDRIYRAALSEDQAIAEIAQCSGTQFDPEIVALFMQCRPEIEAILADEHRPQSKNRGAE